MSSVKRGRPQCRTAWAPKTYHPAFSPASAADNAPRSSAGGASDDTQGTPDAMMGLEISQTIGLGGPVGSGRPRVAPHVIAHLQHVCGRHDAFLSQPLLLFGVRHRHPVTMGEPDEIVA